VFLMPPSYEELERRLKARSLEDDETVRMRLAIAGKEISRYRDYDFIVINDNINESAAVLEAVVRAGSAKPVNQEARIRTIIDTFGRGDA
jgi:guanylate kinase